MIPRSLFFWTVTLEAAVLVVLLGMLAFQRFFGGPSAPPESAEIRHTDSSRPIPALAEPLILIDKSDLLLILYDGDREIARFPAALGRDKGDKTREGDYRTPEGKFYVCLKNPESKFVLSLGLSYPNAEDARRGLDDGLISKREYDRIIAALNKGAPS